MSCDHINNCDRCGNIVDRLEEERDALYDSLEDLLEFFSREYPGWDFIGQADAEALIERCKGDM